MRPTAVLFVFASLVSVTIFAADPKPYVAMDESKANAFLSDALKSWNADKSLRIDVSDFEAALTAAVVAEDRGTEWKTALADIGAKVEKMYRDEIETANFRATLVADGFGDQWRSLKTLLTASKSTILFKDSKFAETVGTYLRERSIIVPADTVVVLGHLSMFDAVQSDGFVVLPRDYNVALEADLAVPTALLKGYQGKLDKIELKFQIVVRVPFKLVAGLLRKQFQSHNIFFLNKHVYDGRATNAEAVAVHELQHLVDTEFSRHGSASLRPSLTWTTGAAAAWKKLQEAKPKEFAAYRTASVDEAMRNERRTRAEVETEFDANEQRAFAARFEMLTNYYRNPLEIRAYEAESAYLIRRHKFDRKRYEESLKIGYWFSADQHRDHLEQMAKINKDAPANPADTYFEAWNTRARLAIFDRVAAR